MKAVHFGAGNIGRGFIGEVLNKNQFSITYLDTNAELIEQLNHDQGYEIQYLADDIPKKWIDRVKAINSLTQMDQAIEALAEADLITTSVGANNLNKIATVLKAGLLANVTKRKNINVLANENMINASSTLKKAVYQISNQAEQAILDQKVYFVDTAIDRQSLSKNQAGKMIVVVEPYYEWVISKTQLAPDTPFELKTATFVDELTPFIERKLFIVNASHAAFAYVGALFGYQTVQAAIQNPNIYHLVQAFLNENSRYFVQQYHQSAKELSLFIKQTLTRHSNPRLADPITRVGRSPIRKLSKTDRLVSPVLKLAALGLENEVGKKIIACAYLYRDEKDEEALNLQKQIQQSGYEETIQAISEVSASLATDIATNCRMIQIDPEKVFEEGA